MRNLTTENTKNAKRMEKSLDRMDGREVAR
jgi:hypothetical protein